MSSKFRLAAAGLAATCFLTSMAGCGAANRMQQQTAPNGTITRQGMNLSQRMTGSTNPNLLMQGTGYGTTPGVGYGTAPSATPGAYGTQSMPFSGMNTGKVMTNIANVDGAKNIKAVVFGNTALVGYTPSGTLRNTAATKNAITKRVKTLDSRVKNVVISEAPDIAGGIQRLSNNTFNQLLQKAKGPY